LLRAMTIETPFDRVRIATAQGADARSAIISCVRRRPDRTAPRDLNDLQTVTHDAANPRQSKLWAFFRVALAFVFDCDLMLFET